MRGQIEEAERRCAIKLSDAMRERAYNSGEEESGEPVREAKVSETVDPNKSGFRFQRCGGGVRIIRRQRRAY